MTKSILIIDTPKIDKDTQKGCRNCKYAVRLMTLSEEYLCNLTGKSAYVYRMQCPLSLMPKPINEEQALNITQLNDHTYLDGVIDGFDICLNRLLIGEEEND